MSDNLDTAPVVNNRPWRLAALSAVVVIVLVAVWLVARGGSHETAPAGARAAVAPSAFAAREMTPAGLAATARRLSRPVYWLGARKPGRYEATLTTSGRFYVRYLPPGVPVGARNVEATTVGTYPVRNGFQALEVAARRAGSHLRRLPGNGIMVTVAGRPRSAYVSYPGAQYEVEVFDPVARRAGQSVLSGRLQAVGR
jgi:hypothetical protein